MYSDSLLIKKLNRDNTRLKETRIFTISGKGCDTSGKDGDGVVSLESSKLDHAESFEIQGKCDDTFKSSLHGDLLDIDKYPEVYDSILEILEE